MVTLVVVLHRYGEFAVFPCGYYVCHSYHYGNVSVLLR